MNQRNQNGGCAENTGQAAMKNLTYRRLVICYPSRYPAH